MHKHLARTLNPIPLVARVGLKLPVEMDDTNITHSLDHFSVVGKKIYIYILVSVWDRHYVESDCDVWSISD